MTGDVTLTAALRSNLLSLQGTQRNLDITQMRLATGRKVNSAIDNPSSFFGAQALNNRAGDLSRLLDGMGQGIQTLKSADEGITAITRFLEQLQAVGEDARDTATDSVTIEGEEFDAAEAADMIGATALTDEWTFNVTVGGGTAQSVEVNTGDTLQAIAGKIDALDGVSATVEAGEDDPDDFRIVITSSEEVVIADDNGTPADVLGIDGTHETSVVPPDRDALESDFNELMSQIDSMVRDAGYRGNNLLNGDDLTVFFNENRDASLTIEGVTFDAEGLGINEADFDSLENIDAALAEIRAALDSVRTQARTFGNNLSTIQTREDFTSGLINTLQEGADKLTLADQNEEAAKMLSLQTAQQLGITALALASQSQQSVLRLF